MKRIWAVCVCGFIFLTSATSGDKKHSVRKGDTLYSLSRTYGVSAAEIAKANSRGLNDGIKIGETLIIPGVKTTAPATSTNASYPVKKFTPRQVASTPDTPYRDEDNRPRSERTAAQEIPQTEEAVSTLSAPANHGLRTGSSNPVEYPGIFNQYATQGYKISKLRGTASYIADVTSGNQNLVFYNHAETGSVVRITNMLNHKTIFAKVMGKVPPAEAAQDVMLKVTSSAADELGVEEARFLVEVASFSVN